MLWLMKGVNADVTPARCYDWILGCDDSNRSCVADEDITTAVERLEKQRALFNSRLTTSTVSMPAAAWAGHPPANTSSSSSSASAGGGGWQQQQHEVWRLGPGSSNPLGSKGSSFASSSGFSSGQVSRTGSWCGQDTAATDRLLQMD